MQGGNEKLRVIIHTNLIEIKFFWNKKTVLSQIAILFFLFLMRTIGFTQSIKSFCTLGMMIDIGIILIMVLPGFYFATEMAVPGADANNSNGDVTQADSAAPTQQVQIDHSTSNTANVVSEVNDTISNTVGGTVSAPTPAPAPVQASTPEPAPTEAAPDFDNISSMFDSFNEPVQNTASEQSSQTQEADLDDGGIFDLFANF